MHAPFVNHRAIRCCGEPRKLDAAHSFGFIHRFAPFSKIVQERIGLDGAFSITVSPASRRRRLQPALAHIRQLARAVVSWQLGFHKTKEEACQAMAAFEEICLELGLKLKLSKKIEPTQTMVLVVAVARHREVAIQRFPVPLTCIFSHVFYSTNRSPPSFVCCSAVRLAL